MKEKLLAMLTLVSAVAVTGATVAYQLYTPQPSSRTMAEVRDAGITEGQPVGVLLHEKDISRQTVKRIRALQGDDIIRPNQRYFTVLRPGRCFGDKYLDGGYGNCVRVDGGSFEPFIEEVYEYRYTQDDGGRYWAQSSTGLPLGDGGTWAPDLRNDGGLFERVGTVPRLPQLAIPSLRQDLDGGVLDSDGGVDDGGDDDVVDDAVSLPGVTILHCQQVDALVDAGVLRNPYSNRFCAALNRLAVQPEPCMIPDGWHRGADGGWCEETACLDPAGPGGYRPCEPGDTCGQVDCKFTGPYGLSDGGPRWRGFNVGPREYAVGSACVPVECGVVAGDVPFEWL